MLEEVLNHLYSIGEALLYEYSDENKCKYINMMEHNFYSNLGFTGLKFLEKITKDILEQLDAYYCENFEVAMKNTDEQLIFRRIYNQVSKYINNFIKHDDGQQPVFADLYHYQGDKVIYLDNLGGSLNNLEEDMITNIEAKFLLLLINNYEIEQSYKTNIVLNTLYVNPHLEEKTNYGKHIINNVKEEDCIYNGLNLGMQSMYDKNLNEYSLNTLKDLFYDLLVNYKTPNELKTIQLYIRSIFNSLDDEILEELNYNFNEMNVKILNKDGENIIRQAFRRIESDRELIHEIKNIR